MSQQSWLKLYLNHNLKTEKTCPNLFYYTYSVSSTDIYALIKYLLF